MLMSMSLLNLSFHFVWWKGGVPAHGWYTKGSKKKQLIIDQQGLWTLFKYKINEGRCRFPEWGGVSTGNGNMYTMTWSKGNIMMTPLGASSPIFGMETGTKPLRSTHFLFFLEAPKMGYWFLWHGSTVHTCSGWMILKAGCLGSGARECPTFHGQSLRPPLKKATFDGTHLLHCRLKP